jgi:hypothetical protein
VKWLHFNRSEGCTENEMYDAAWNGHLETLKWLYINRSEGCAKHWAAFNSHLEIVKWLDINKRSERR